MPRLHIHSFAFSLHGAEAFYLQIKVFVLHFGLMKNSYGKPKYNKWSKPNGKFGGKNGTTGSYVRKVRTPLVAPLTAPILRPVTLAKPVVARTMYPTKPFVPAHVRNAVAINTAKSLGLTHPANPMKKSAGKAPIPTKAPGEFPMRINKYLGWKGFATRRDADKLIEKRQVTINGRFAALGDQVLATDTVEVRRNKKADTYLYYAYNKPRGIVTDISRKGGVKDIMQSISLRGVFPVGGLDANSEGLVILTNDRRITDRLLNPAHEHMKEYTIIAKNSMKPNFKEKMEAGVTIGKNAPIQCRVHILRDKLFTLTMSDNGNHIRTMCNMFFTEVESLTRTAILNIRLDKMTPNSYRPIKGEELATFLRSLGL